MSDSKDNLGNTAAPKVARKNTFYRFWSMVLGALVLLIIALTSLGKYGQILLKTPQTPVGAQAECAIVLTGGAGRVREGIALLSQKVVKKLIISGVHSSSTLSEMFPEILFYPEIALDDVILERRSSSTAGNAQQSLPIVEALHCQSVLLVTSDYHLYRAYKTFITHFPPSVSIIGYPIPSDRLIKRSAFIVDTKFWSAVFDEWIKYLFYSVVVF